MTTSPIKAETWLEAMREAASEVAVNTMGFEGCQVRRIGNQIPEGVSGSCISLTGDGEAVQVGFLTSQKDCVTLARAMLGMTPDEDGLSEADAVDAMGEVINIIAGGVKKQFHTESSSLQLGLPIIVTGRIGPGNHQEAIIAEVNMGPVPAYLMILKEKDS